MSKDRVRKRVRGARENGQLVRIRRSRGWDALEGVVVDHGPKWLLLAVEFDAGFYGHCILRIRDITDFSDQRPSFVAQALAGEGHWPMPTLDQIDVSGSTKELVASLVALGRPAAYHYERRDPHSMLIGLPVGNEDHVLRLHTIDTHARWDDVSRIRYRDLTRVDIDSGYLKRLLRISGNHPGDPIQVTAELRLRQFDPWQADDQLLRDLLVSYQDPDSLRMVDGPRARPYKLRGLKDMFRYMSDHGELYLIERLNADGTWKPIGDAALQPGAIPVVIAPGHRNQGIGRAVVAALIGRARQLGWRSVNVSDIYDYNTASRRLYTSWGFVGVGATELGHRYRLDLS
ncbi:hypothetical protein GCM10011575_19660 [Microlunatus endophyticus]|uniref:N-acetyltransferase domain-containing protein n=1 Tax=Microlunatus endophyticus TaxID=1716077 RepID=A0A917W483_9ACTN|nr:GNAT family N-acetyltransferase [Microlunatus endophyticus]GGL61147.1 hypothetical protein GCM10011575_19660 [Microlunatus endophyticus]